RPMNAESRASLAAAVAAAPVAAPPVAARSLLPAAPASGPSLPGSLPPGAPTPRPGLPVSLYGHHAVVGPAGTAPCRDCLARRWLAVRPGWLRDALELGGGTVAAGAPPQWSTAFATDAIAALAAHLATEPAANPAPLLLLDLETLRVGRTALLADPACPSCGGSTDDSAAAARITLRRTPKTAGSRARPLDTYDLPVEALVNPVAGALGAGPVPDLTSTTTSSVSGLFTFRSGDYLRETFWGGHTGDYRRSLRVGLLEGLERAAGMRPRGRRTSVVASLDDLGDVALDPRTCGTYGPEFHDREPGVRPFTPDRPIAWVWGWSLRDRRPVLVPEVLTYYSAPGGPAERFVQESSNGCASGGCLTEAVLFGLMEVVERDAFLLTWYGGQPVPEIDVGTIRWPATRALIDRLALIGYTARFFDCRVSFPVPVVTAVAVRTDGGPGTLCFGAGAALDPEEAVAGGLSEIATDAANLRRRTEQDGPRLRALAADFEQVLSLHDHPLLYGLPEMRRHAAFLLDRPHPTVPLPEPAFVSGDLRADLEWTVGVLAARGFDVVAVDQTSPEQAALGLATASVLVPGLLPIDFGWRRQRALRMPRLRTALREAGRRPCDLDPAELNLAPHPFP
ncbi:MAG TPA: TOMM precursor leader peptide-binding protein, partial [Mycobacteriales bacterium]|nr:TOMM precursor leader peptide-binding protein [Mycobacteriales bacterium]